MAVERVLADLRRELRTLGWRARCRALAEVRDHLLSSVEDEVARGSSAADAERRTVERFGDVTLIASRFLSGRQSRGHRMRTTLAGAVVVVAMLALPAGPLQDALAPRQAVASPVPILPNRVVETQCVAAWNGNANARWRAYAAHLGTVRAYVDVAYAATSNGRRFVPTHRGCIVKLWLARRTGPWQYAILIGGPLLDGKVSYGTRVFPGAAKTPLHVHRRTTIQFANTRVRSNGTLDYVGVSIPESRTVVRRP